MKKSFDEVFIDNTKYCTKIKTSDYYEQGEYAIIDQGQNQIAGYTSLQDGVFNDIPAIIFGDHTRIIKYIDEPFFIGADGVKVLKSKLPNSNYKYLYYALKNADIPNTGYNRHFKWLKEVKINYPSIEKQNEVVEILDRIVSIIDFRKQQLQQLDELVKARFVELFGDPEMNTKNYKTVMLSEIAEYYNGLTYSPDDVSENGTIVLRSSNIQDNQLDFADTVRVNCTIKEKLYVRDNDILMCSRNGSARLVGKVALMKNIFEPMSFGAFMMIIRSKYYSYLMTYFQMDAFRRQIKTGATTTINQITGNMLNKISLPLPEINEINEFADFVKEVDKSKFVGAKSN